MGKGQRSSMAYDRVGGDVFVTIPDRITQMGQAMLQQHLARTILAFALIGSCAMATAQQPGPRKFYAVSDLQQTGAGPVLIGGRPANSSDFPASFYSMSAGGSCTSTMVSARVLLSAAHCVPDGEKVRIVSAKKEYEATCAHAPDYKVNETADWALCLLNEDLPGIKFERIGFSATLKVGSEVLLTGFGCTKSPGVGGNDGIYRVGESTVTRLPSGESNDIVTTGGAALCFGDSGGPAFVFLDAIKRGRVLISVNSRANIKDTSYLSSVGTNPAKKFLADWAVENSVRICGVHTDAQNCRPL